MRTGLRRKGKLMNIEMINQRLAEIKAVGRDVEVAHNLEDDLAFEVLRAIAEGASNPAELARQALKIAEIW